MRHNLGQLGSCLSLVSLLLGCNLPTQSLDQSAKQNNSRTSSNTEVSTDAAAALSIEKTWTNSKDIPVSWMAVPNATEYQLLVASDEDCKTVRENLRTRNTSTGITDLPEGTWYLCLSWKIEPRIHQSTGKGLLLVVDRKAPDIEGDGIQTIALDESPLVKVTDANEVKCNWSSSSEVLKINAGDSMLPLLSTPVAGTYFVELNCEDLAGNSASQSFSLTLAADPNAALPTTPIATPTPTPTATPDPGVPPTVSAGPDLLRKDAVTLASTATGASSYQWSQVSGPGMLTFSAPTSLQTSVSASADGVYVVRLKATSASGLSAEDDMTLTWDTTAPTVNAGQDVVIGVATTLGASVGSDAVSISWRKVSGTGNIIFSSTTIAAPLISASADGVYILELTATDAAGNTRSDQMQFQWLTTVPTVNVGPDLSAKSIVSVSPTASGATSYAWTKVSGPGTITFSAVAAKNTSITASADGTYVIKLTASNAQGVSANDTLTLIWDTVPPSVNAGLDRSANLAITQTGTATGATTYAWTKVSGTGTVTFGSPSTLATTISASADGAYTLRLTATDAAGNAASDDMVLTWDTTAPNSVTAFTATPGVKTMALSWTDGGGGTSAYLVLRSTAAITATPVRGTLYTTGGTLGAATVVAAGSSTSLADSNLTGNATYYYQVFAYDALGNYSAGVQSSAAALPLRTLKANLVRSSLYSAAENMGIQNYGNTTYVCRGERGLDIVNVTNPAAPTLIGTNTLGNTSKVGWCSDVKVSGNYAFVADWGKGFMAVDISNPAAPVVKGSVPLTNASIVTLSGNYAYVAVEDDTTGGGLAIINISNPAVPVLSKYTETDGNATGVGKLGNYVYLSHRDTGNFVGLKVFNVTTPTAPTIVQSFDRENMEELTVSGSYVYVAVGAKGLEIFDATNPASLVSKSTKALPNAADVAGSVSVADNYAFIASYDTFKMYIMDVTTKTAPTVLKSYATYQSQSPLYIHVSGAYAYMSVENRGMEIIEVFTLQ